MKTYGLDHSEPAYITAFWSRTCKGQGLEMNLSAVPDLGNRTPHKLIIQMSRFPGAVNWAKEECALARKGGI